MKKRSFCTALCILLFVCLGCLPVWARAGGGGSSGGGGGGGSSSHSGSYHGGGSSGRTSVGGYVIQLVVLGAVAGGGSTALIIKSRAAKARSKRAMAVYAQMGGNWDYREIQQQVEETYFQVQECWRRMDVSYGAGYLSQELQDEFSSKLQWMQVRNEGVVQKNVRLLSAVPVYVIDHPAEEKDELWYLIHGKMKGYYIDLNTRKVVRGNPRNEAFFEYWRFVYRNKRWVLAEIRQKDEIDIDAFGDTLP